jgi:hypothetical protein
MSPARSVTKQPILSTNCERPDTVLAGIVGEAATTVQKISFRIGFLVFRIGHSLVHPASLGRMLLVQPEPESFQDLWCFFVPVCVPLLVSVSVFPAIPLNGK